MEKKAYNKPRMEVTLLRSTCICNTSPVPGYGNEVGAKKRSSAREEVEESKTDLWGNK